MLADGTYTGSGTEVLEIGKNITIRALNAGQAVLDGENARRIILISGGTVVLNHLNITRGYVSTTDPASTGAGVRIDGGSVNINSCTINRNEAYSGGGVAMKQATVNIGNCTINDNQAAGLAGEGAAIYIWDATANISSCIINNNIAIYFGGGISINHGYVAVESSQIYSNTAYVHGGGLHMRGSSIVAITSSNIYENTAQYGGGISIYQSAVVTITNAIVYQNSAARNRPNPGYGGGIEIRGESGTATVTIETSQIYSNTANYCPALSDPNCDHLDLSCPYGICPGAGGGLYIAGSSIVTITSSNIFQNKVLGNGGGIATAGTRPGAGDLSVIGGTLSGTVNINGCAIHNNEAGTFGGGGVSIMGGRIAIETSQLDNNTASDRGSAIYNSGVDNSHVSIGPDVVFTGHNESRTIDNPGTIFWTCQLGYFQQTSGSYGTGTPEDPRDFDTCSSNRCLAGGYGNSPNLTNIICSGLCPIGHFCEGEATVTPLPCSPGTFFPSVGANNQSLCTPCFPGQYQPAAGQALCEACSAGTYSAVYGSTACESCPSGGFCPNAAAGSLALAFTPCSPGTFNSERGQSSGNACQECPLGTSNPLAGQRATSACKSCNPGYVP